MVRDRIAPVLACSRIVRVPVVPLPPEEAVYYSFHAFRSKLWSISTLPKLLNNDRSRLLQRI